MVFFFYVGGGWRGMAASIGFCALSMLFSGQGPYPRSGTIDGWGATHDDFDWQQYSGAAGGFEQRWPRGGGRGRRYVGSTGFSQTFGSNFLVGFAIVSLLGWVFRYLLRYPRFALHPAVQCVQNVLQRFGFALRSLLQGFVPPQMREPNDTRERASAAQVQSLPVEVFVSESELQQWNAGQLKDELRRLQRLSDLRMNFSGGSATKEVHCLLRGGGAVEKSELVTAVLTARGGESGTSCIICLAHYESGASLRVLPCGHRFHTTCVDQWLTEQSRTCPLCSKRV